MAAMTAVPAPRPDGVGGADVHLEFQYLGQEQEGGGVSGHDDEGPALVGEAVAEFEGGGRHDLDDDRGGQDQPCHGVSP
ncbi:hypothetical protein GCM10017559_00960 [Streptosporangium longisporum]|uniref:Uncharacterized protein n=1 Tax=Streptosporangium longisporum TaxID=46187 RepID=A0ABN2K3A0_9ACTN